MSFLIEHDPSHVRFQMDEAMPIGWAAHGLECGLLWFLGSEHWRINISRELGPGDTVWFHVQPIDGKRGPIVWSNFAPLSSLLDAKVFPHRLTEVWPFDDKRDASGIIMHELKLDVTLGMMAYGLADVAIDFFKRGAVWVRAQYSFDQSQITSNASLNEAQVKDLASQRPSYVGSETVAALPWPGRARKWDIQPGAGKSGAV